MLRALALSTAPVVSSSATRSVKVPPMSTPMRRATDRQYRPGASGAATTSRPTRRDGSDYLTIREVIAARQLLLLLDSTTTAVWSEHASRK